MRYPPGALRTPHAGFSGEDPWAGEAGTRLEEDLARRWLPAAAPQPDSVPAVSFLLLRVLLVCALVSAMVWALTGYGAYRLLAG